jgi:hypothetical protein
MLNVVPFHQTPLPMAGSDPSVVSVLARIYQTIEGTLPDPRLLASAAAIIGVENAGGAAINNYNWGNLSASDGDVWESPYYAQTGKGPEYFKAFDSQDAGAAAWWTAILTKFRSVLPFMLNADMQGLARELYRSSYVVAISPNEQANYARGLQSMIRKAWADAHKLGAQPTNVQKGSGLFLVVGTVVTSSALLLWHSRRAA